MVYVFVEFNNITFYVGASFRVLWYQSGVLNVKNTNMSITDSF